MHHTMQAKCNVHLRDLCNNLPDNEEALPARTGWMVLLQAGFSRDQIKTARMYFGLGSVRQNNQWYWKPWGKPTPYKSEPDDNGAKPLTMKRRREPNLREQMK